MLEGGVEVRTPEYQYQGCPPFGLLPPSCLPHPRIAPLHKDPKIGLKLLRTMNVKKSTQDLRYNEARRRHQQFFSAEIFVLPGLIRAVFVLACGPTTWPMGPRHQSLNVKKLAAGAEQISGMLVLRGEAPGRNFRGTGT